MEEEIWKDVVGYEEYFQISSYGNVFSKRTNKNIKLNLSKTGYWQFSTKFNGRKGQNKLFKVHRIVAEAFLDPPRK